MLLLKKVVLFSDGQLTTSIVVNYVVNYFVKKVV